MSHRDVTSHFNLVCGFVNFWHSVTCIIVRKSVHLESRNNKNEKDLLARTGFMKNLMQWGYEL